MNDINYKHVSFSEIKRSEVDFQIFYGDQTELAMIELDLAMTEIFGGRDGYRSEIKRMVDEESEDIFNWVDEESGHVFN